MKKPAKAGRWMREAALGARSPMAVTAAKGISAAVGECGRHRHQGHDNGAGQDEGSNEAFPEVLEIAVHGHFPGG